MYFFIESGETFIKENSGGVRWLLILKKVKP